MMKLLRKITANFNFRQALSVVFAGFLLFTTVACSSGGPAQTSNPSVGGNDMYPYEDTRRDTTAADAKAQRTIQEAEQRREKVLNPQKDYLEETKPAKQIKKQAKEAADTAQKAAADVGDSAQKATDNAARNTQQGIKNLKENTQEAIEEAT